MAKKKVKRKPKAIKARKPKSVKAGKPALKKPAPEYVLVYITAGDIREVDTIREVLLKERLVACVNAFPVHSVWWWEGKLERGPEMAVLAKTKREFVKDIIREVRAIHAYEIPCVLVLPILEGNPEYLAWIDKVTLSKSEVKK